MDQEGKASDVCAENKTEDFHSDSDSDEEKIAEISDLESVYGGPYILNLASRLKNDSKLVEIFDNLLTSLKKEDEKLFREMMGQIKNYSFFYNGILRGIPGKLMLQSLPF